MDMKLDDECGMRDEILEYLRMCRHPQSAASVMAHLKQAGIIPRNSRKGPVNAMLYALAAAGMIERHDVQPPAFSLRQHSHT